MIIGSNFKNKFFRLWNKWLKVEHRKINYGKLIANDLSYLCHHDDDLIPQFNKIDLRKLFRHFFYKQTNSPYVFPENTQGKNSFDILFVHEEDGRMDYQRQCQFVLKELEAFNVQNIYIDKDALNKPQLTFSLPGAFSKLGLFIKIVLNFSPFGKKFTHRSLAKTLHLYYKAFIYYDFSVQLKKFIGKDQQLFLLTFSDMKEYCNLATQIARNARIRSATLQHAAYIKNNDESWSQADINYLNFTSDYLLAWGEAVKLQLKNTPLKSSQFLIAGCNVPGTPRRLTVSSQNLPAERRIGLIMSAEYWRASNLKMLEMAQKLSADTGIPFEILFHPSNAIETYLSAAFTPTAYFRGMKDAKDFFNSKTFLISHTTTLYITSLTHLRRCFRYKDAAFIDLGGLDDTFSQYEELLQKVLNKGYIIDQDGMNAINELLSFHLGKETDSYGMVFEQLLGNEPATITDPVKSHYVSS